MTSPFPGRGCQRYRAAPAGRVGPPPHRAPAGLAGHCLLLPGMEQGRAAFRRRFIDTPGGAKVGRSAAGVAGRSAGYA